MSPAPFLRFGFVFLAFCVALSVGFGQAATLGAGAWVAAAIVFVLLGALGEVMFR
ncbi:MAG: hypothetical protein JSS20_21755, partial [Proteobacteria bacterium]|nr:hypothetical protein [Pseudomonadota bacterium]